jgi:mono/diheme cytochrome c family protein
MRVSLQRLAPIVLLLAACGGAAATSSSTSAGAAPAAVRAPSPEMLASIARGDSLFNTGACQRCHGQKGIGAQNGPSLVAGQWLHVDGTQAKIAALIVSGVPRAAVTDSTRRFPMRPRGGPMNLTDDQVQDLAAYVVSISRAKRAR